MYLVFQTAFCLFWIVHLYRGRNRLHLCHRAATGLAVTAVLLISGVEWLTRLGFPVSGYYVSMQSKLFYAGVFALVPLTIGVSYIGELIKLAREHGTRFLWGCLLAIGIFIAPISVRWLKLPEQGYAWLASMSYWRPLFFTSLICGSLTVALLSVLNRKNAHTLMLLCCLVLGSVFVQQVLLTLDGLGNIYEWPMMEYAALHLWVLLLYVAAFISACRAARKSHCVLSAGESGAAESRLWAGVVVVSVLLIAGGLFEVMQCGMMMIADFRLGPNPWAMLYLPPFSFTAVVAGVWMLCEMANVRALREQPTRSRMVRGVVVGLCAWHAGMLLYRGVFPGERLRLASMQLVLDPISSPWVIVLIWWILGAWIARALKARKRTQRQGASCAV